MRRKTFGVRSGFTLVEMLVVITIIGILVALLIPTIAGVMRGTRNAATGVELQDLAKAVEAYKSFASDYPPDFTNVGAVSAHMARGFSRNTRDINAWWLATDSNGRKYSDLDPAEALVIWLSQLSNNPRDPLAGVDPAFTGERKVFFKFDDTRLTCPLGGVLAPATKTDLDQDNWPEYVPQYGNQAPYVYFDGRVLGGAYAYQTARYPKTAPLAPPFGSNTARPYRSNTDIVTARDNNRTQPRDVPLGFNLQQWMNPGGFQIICAGQDNDFGPDITAAALVFKTYPAPNYTLVGPDEDNLTSFSDMSILADKVP